MLAAVLAAALAATASAQSGPSFSTTCQEGTEMGTTAQLCGTCFQGAANATGSNLAAALQTCCSSGCKEMFPKYEAVVRESCAAELAAGTIPLTQAKTFITQLDTACKTASTITATINDACAPKRTSAPNGGRRSICQVFNDPHVKTFTSGANVLRTCNVTGTMTLLDNTYLSITAQAQAITQDPAASFRGASFVSSVTVTYKNTSCGSSRTFTSAGAWADAKLFTSIIVTDFTTRAGQKILNVRVVSPWTTGTGVCVSGCPAGTQVDVKPQTKRRLLATHQRALLATQAEATAACTAQGLSGAALDVCVFDSVSTGDTTSFVTASSAVVTALAAEEQVVNTENTVFIATAGSAMARTSVVALLILAALLLAL